MGYSQRFSVFMRADPSTIYTALLDPQAIAEWRVPDGMSCEVHQFDAREGGRFRISLTYDVPNDTGKSASSTDTYGGHFASLVPDERVVEVMEFETAAAELQGQMTVTTTLAQRDNGTEVTMEHDGIPDVVSRADNEAGTRMALANLARLVEHAAD